MNGEPYVFISYARSDDAAFVERLRDDLMGRGIPVWWDKAAMESRGLSFLQEIRDAIAGAQRMVLVTGPRAAASAYVEAEWRFALEACTVVTPVMRMGEDSHVPADLSRLHRVDFRDNGAYSNSLDELTRLLRTPPARLGPLLGVDALPPHHVARADLLDSLSQAVLADAHEPAAVPRERGVIAVVGMTGSGKSVAAAAFARQCGTRRAFSDGLLWVKLRRQDEPLRVLNLLRALLGDHEAHGTEARAVAALSHQLAGKRCLIVLDDVWDTSVAERVADALGPTSRLLLTTQRGDLALAAQNVASSVLSDASSLLLLARSAGLPDASSLPAVAGPLSDACGKLPLSLAMVGAMLRGKPESRWAATLGALRKVELDRIRAKLPRYEHPSLLRAMHASVEALNDDEVLRPDTAERYLELAVFDKDGSIPEAAFLVLWQPCGISDFDVQGLCDTFVDRSLLRRTEDGRYTLHNLQWDYLQNRQADLSGIHRRLVHSYRERCKGRWPGGADDGYYFQNLPRHLHAADEVATLRSLLADLSWLRAKLGATDPWTLASDARFVPSGEVAMEVLYAALRMSAPVLEAHRDQLEPQLLGRLGGRDDPLLAKLLQDLRDREGAWLEPLWPTLRRPDGSLIWSLEGHDSGAYAVAVTPDGRYAAIGTARGRVVLWDLESGRRIQDFRGPEEWAHNVSLTPQRSHVAAAYGARGIVVWDATSGRRTMEVAGENCAARAIAFMRDRRHVLTGQDDGSVRLWEVDGGAAAGALEGKHQTLVQALVVTPDGKRAISAAADGTLGLWDLAAQRLDALVPTHSRHVWSVALDIEARRVVSCSDSGAVAVNDIVTGNKLGEFQTGTWSFGCCFLEDSGRIVTSDADGELKVWNASGTLLRRIRAHDVFADRVAGLRGSMVISTCRDGTAKVWNVDRERDEKIEGHTAPVLGVALSGALSGICSASQDGTLRLWDMGSGTLLSTIDACEGPVREVAFIPGTSRLIAADAQGQLAIFDLRGPQLVGRVAAHLPAVSNTEQGTSFGLGGVVSLRIVRDGALAWSCGAAGDIAGLDLEQGQLTRSEVRLEPPVVGDIAADGVTAVLGSGHGSLAMVNLADGSSVTMEAGSLSSFMAVELDPSGRFAVSSHADGAVVCWALRRHARVLVKPDPAAGVTIVSWETGRRQPVAESARVAVARGLAITAGAELLVAAFSDGWLRLWRLDNLEPYAAFCFDEELHSCAVDGSLIAVGGRSRVHLLKIRTGEENTRRCDSN